jgi:hypothetical protein
MEIIMTNKTPFEIRTDLLQQAQNILNERMYAERQRLENDWNLKRDEWNMKACNNEFTEAPPFPFMPMVTSEEIIAEAKKLNDFVSKG